MNSSVQEATQFTKAVSEYEINELLVKAIEHHQAQHFAEAERLYRLILAADPQHSVALNNLSLMLDVGGALDILHQVVASQPDYADALINISSRLLEKGDIDEAAKYISRANTLEPLDDRVVELMRQIHAADAANSRRTLKHNEVPVYSIVVPTHSRANLLSRALESLKGQTSKSAKEIIVVSDVDDLATNAVCSQWLERSDTFVRRAGSPGPSASRNLALKLARGQNILFLDDDDAWHPNLLAELDQCETLMNGQPIYFNCSVVKESRPPEGPVFIGENFVNTQNQLDENVFIKNQVHMSCFAFPRVLLQGLEFDVHMRAYEDWDFLLSVFERVMPSHVPILGSKIYEVDDATTDRRGNSTLANDNNALIDFVYVYRRHVVKAHLREKRANLLSSAGLSLSAELL